MATLLLENVPDELLRELEQRAALDRVPLAEKTVRLLQQALGQRPTPQSSRVREILERMARNRFQPDPSGPSVVDMLREDRNR